MHGEGLRCYHGDHHVPGGGRWRGVVVTALIHRWLNNNRMWVAILVMTCILGNNETKYSIESSLMERGRHHGRTLNHAWRGIAALSR
jgi:hypothetical protein